MEMIFLRNNCRASTFSIFSSLNVKKTVNELKNYFQTIYYNYILIKGIEESSNGSEENNKYLIEMKEWMSRREPLMGSDLRNIFKLLLINNFRVHPKYWYRLFMTFNINFLCLPLRLIEKIRFNKKIRRTKVRDDPIFIIGHWRTGTTFLHYLLTQDNSKGFVPNQLAYVPHFSLTAKKFAQRLVKFGLPETRPMDDIKLSPELPGEEEFAMALTCKYSFYHVFIFPRKMNCFSKYLTFKETSNREKRKWKNKYYRFIQKTSFVNGDKRLVLKNPPNTARIKLLKEMFPNAKFIFLSRNPYEILLSTIKLYNRLLPLFSFQKWDIVEIKRQIIQNFNEMNDEYQKNKTRLSNNELIEIKYEDLIKNPLLLLKKIYSFFELNGYDENKINFEKYIKKHKDYKNMNYEINPEVIKIVNNSWNDYFEVHNYKKMLENENLRVPDSKKHKQLADKYLDS